MMSSSSWLGGMLDTANLPAKKRNTARPSRSTTPVSLKLHNENRGALGSSETIPPEKTHFLQIGQIGGLRLHQQLDVPARRETMRHFAPLHRRMQHRRKYRIRSHTCNSCVKSCTWSPLAQQQQWDHQRAKQLADLSALQ
jgi:hypothetical protein